MLQTFYARFSTRTQLQIPNIPWYFSKLQLRYSYEFILYDGDIMHTLECKKFTYKTLTFCNFANYSLIVFKLSKIVYYIIIIT